MFNNKGNMYFFTIVLCLALLLFFFPVFEYIRAEQSMLVLSETIDSRVEQSSVAVSAYLYDEVKSANPYKNVIPQQYIDLTGASIFSGLGFELEDGIWINDTGVYITDIDLNIANSNNTSVIISYTVNSPYYVLGVRLRDISKSYKSIILITPII